MRIEAIYVAGRSGADVARVDSVQVVAYQGIVGDRNFGKAKWPGQNVTFVEAEAIEAFAAPYGRALEPGELRRNIVTRGVRLNELVGRRFRVGDVQFRGVELCEPCRNLGARLATAQMPVPSVVRAWVRRGGLRTDALRGGILRVGMDFEIDAD
ncbi:MOSC domain-containing protein [Solimonas marina]|uniref:MOSC domain-containing protein n=1 Tax=Solimonas marina TaxID=2714601 RepID=A0A970B6Q0_9GAMM|nr:MOSC domain-containing protein [Solimonas marina]NKF22835.1 MOSC domain-containing protein [Solimonas marina]